MLSLDKINTRLLSLFAIFMQTCGLSLFEGQGWFCMGIVILLNLKNVKKINEKKLRTLFYWFIVFLAVMLIKGMFDHLQWITYMSFVFFGTLLFLLDYANKKFSFIDDLYQFLKILYYYSLLHILVLILFHSFLVDTTIPMKPKTFLYLFYFNNKIGIEPFFYRIQGIAWEPGNWQLFLNLFLLFSILKKKSLTQLILTGVAILSTFSTNGYILLIVNFVFYLFISNKYKKTIPIAIILSISIFPIVSRNITDKMSGDGQISGLARMRDWKVGQEMMIEYPWVGINPANLDQLDIVRKVKTSLFDQTVNYDRQGEYTGFMEDGFLNGFLGVFLDWGVFFGLGIYFLFYKSPLLVDKKTAILFCIICFLSFTAEPITRTSFFYLFPLSSLFLGFRKMKEELKNE